MRFLSLSGGALLVSLARKSISHYSAAGSLLSEPSPKKEFNEKRGVFVSLHTFPEKQLRGCIGFPLPVLPLWSAVIEAAVSAAFKDSRFPPLTSSELASTTIELSVLSKPIELKCKKEGLPKKIVVGEHGLIVKQNSYSGLLLPQVAAEFGWNSQEFLEQCCEKAGLPKNAWKEQDTRISTFTAQVFSEVEPGGKTQEKQ